MSNLTANNDDLVLSKFVFLKPPRRANTKHEYETIITQRRAYNIVKTAKCRLKWKDAKDLKTVTEVNVDVIYVLYEFFGEVFEHLVELQGRVIGPLVVIQSHMCQLKFPMRVEPTWAQSLYGQVVTTHDIEELSKEEITVKTIQLGGTYKRAFDQTETTILITNSHNSNDPIVLSAINQQVKIFQKGWIDKVYDAAEKLEHNFEHLFTDMSFQLFKSNAATSLPSTMQSSQLLRPPRVSSRLNNSVQNNQSQAQYEATPYVLSLALDSSIRDYPMATRSTQPSPSKVCLSLSETGSKFAQSSQAKSSRIKEVLSSSVFSKLSGRRKSISSPSIEFARRRTSSSLFTNSQGTPTLLDRISSPTLIRSQPLRRKMWTFYLNGYETEVTFRIEDRTFTVGRAILACQSKHFHSILVNELEGIGRAEIEIKDFDKKTVDAFIKWLYLGKIKPGASVDKLFSLAGMYQVKELKNQCANLLAKAITESNAVQCLINAAKYDVNKVKSAALNFLAGKPEYSRFKVFSTAGWKKFSAGDAAKANEIEKGFGTICSN